MDPSFDVSYTEQLRNAGLLFDYARQLSGYMEAALATPGGSLRVAWSLVEDGGGRVFVTLDLHDPRAGRSVSSRFSADEIQSLNWVRPRLHQMVAELAQAGGDASGWHPGTTIGSEDLLLEPGPTAMAVLISGFQEGYVPANLLGLALHGYGQPCVFNGERWFASPSADGPLPTHVPFEVPAGDDDEDETETDEVEWVRDTAPDEVLSERYGVPLARDVRVNIVSNPSPPASH